MSDPTPPQKRKHKRDGGHPNWNRCIYCGLFISHADFDAKLAGTNFTPDTSFSSERLEAYHLRCK